MPEDNKKLAKGQKTLNAFFCDPKEKENEMGLSSNLRKSSIQRSKSFAYSGSKKTKPKNAANPQLTLDGAKAEPRCDEGTKICKACEFNDNEKKKGSSKRARFAHDITCSINKITNGGRISKAQYGGSTQDDVDEFFTPSSVKDDDGDSELSLEPPKGSAAEILEAYSTAKLIARINYYVNTPSSYMKKNTSGSVPKVVAASVQALLDLMPDRFKKGTNKLAGIQNTNTVTYKKLQAYKKIFPPGTVGFAFPRANKTLPPDYNYCQLEGRTIYFPCWELNVPGWEPFCFICGSKMAHDKYDYQSHGYVSPVFDITGITHYCCSVIYDCKCGNRCKSSEGRILMQLPIQFRSGFNVDPRYAVNQERYLSLDFTRVLDDMFITHGNGDQLSTLLNKIRGDRYLDMEEEYYEQAIASGIQVHKHLPPFEQFIGRYSHSGSQLRDLKNAAASSSLLSTGVSDKERCQREIQSVGCDKVSSSDHTFEFIKNYASGLLGKNACGHTIGNNDGEVASIAIVANTSQSQYAHQAEQCSLRSNWKPRIHVTDNCPVGIVLWRILVKDVHCQLGLFHFTQRITKTLNKECSEMNTASKSLQDCLYCFEGTDMEKVKKQIQLGNLARKDGEAFDGDLEGKARTYCEYIRVWTYDEEVIVARLGAWLKQYKSTYDSNQERLFTDYTHKTVAEQMTKAKYVVDVLSKNELYLESKASLRSKTGLSTFIGARGAESKLEKAHHSIAHFANGGMRYTLADFLGLGGIALYNLRIRYRLKLAKKKPFDRAKVPVEFQDSPHFDNHLRLAYNNKLARGAGLSHDVHEDVEILQPDTGELFFYQYYLAQLEREQQKTSNGPNNRCLCRDCGKVNNPYRKRKEAWTNQQDVLLPMAKPPPPPPLAGDSLLIAPGPVTFDLTVPVQAKVTASLPIPASHKPYSELMKQARTRTKRRSRKQKKD